MTALTTFTPGPWRHDTKGNFGNVVEAQSGKSSHKYDSGWRAVATVQDCCASDLYSEQEANRAANIALIAAAPDMLEALRETDHVLNELQTKLTAMASGYYAEGQTEISTALANDAQWCLARIGSLPMSVTDTIAKATGAA